QPARAEGEAAINIHLHLRPRVSRLAEVEARRPRPEVQATRMLEVDPSLDRRLLQGLRDPPECIIAGHRNVAGQPARPRLPFLLRRRSARAQPQGESETHYHASLHLSSNGPWDIHLRGAGKLWIVS